MFFSKALCSALALVGLASAAPTSLEKRLPGRVVKAGEPVVIDANSEYNVWGTLVASFMTKEDVDGTSGYDGAQMKVIMSTDGGKTRSAGIATGIAGIYCLHVYNDPDICICPILYAT